MAERTSVIGYAMLSVIVSSVVFPIAVNITWAGGALEHLDPPFHDFAGSAVVHVIGGVAALVGAALVGPRVGRWDSRRHGDFVPHE